MNIHTCIECGRKGLSRREILGNGDDDGHGLARGGECWECYSKRPARPEGELTRTLFAIEPVVRVMWLDGGTSRTIGVWDPEAARLHLNELGESVWPRVADQASVLRLLRQPPTRVAFQVDLREPGP